MEIRLKVIWFATNLDKPERKDIRSGVRIYWS